MSFPFGGHPTLKQFLSFAQEHGCTAKLVTRTARDGHAYQVLEIRSNKGGNAVLVEPDETEHLTPSTVTYLQRRLGIKTPFSAMPDQHIVSEQNDDEL